MAVSPVYHFGSDGEVKARSLQILFVDFVQGNPRDVWISARACIRMAYLDCGLVASNLICPESYKDVGVRIVGFRDEKVEPSGGTWGRTRKKGES